MSRRSAEEYLDIFEEASTGIPPLMSILLSMKYPGVAEIARTTAKTRTASGHLGPIISVEIPMTIVPPVAIMMTRAVAKVPNRLTVEASKSRGVLPCRLRKRETITALDAESIRDRTPAMKSKNSPMYHSPYFGKTEQPLARRRVIATGTGLVGSSFLICPMSRADPFFFLKVRIEWFQSAGGSLWGQGSLW